MLILKRRTDDLAHNLITYIRNCITKGPSICCNLAGTALNQQCNVLYEIGIIFLKDERVMERATAEEFLVYILHGSEFPTSFKFTALCFLKHEAALLNGRSKRVIAAFEAISQNKEIVQEVKKRLTQE